ncbi:MAG: CSLREA domain-containing protein, partial [Chloroflexaceae bacterium]
MSPRRLWPLLLSVLAVVVVPFAHSPRAEAQEFPSNRTYTVTNTLDNQSTPCQPDSNPSPDGCTLRQAILAANADVEANLIRFDTGFPPGEQIISPNGQPFPALSGNGDRIKGAVDNYGRPRIVIDGLNLA